MREILTKEQRRILMAKLDETRKELADALGDMDAGDIKHYELVITSIQNLLDADDKVRGWYQPA